MTSDGNSMQASASPRRLLFISFAAADVAAAEWLAEHLLLAGYQPWLDKQRLHGEINGRLRSPGYCGRKPSASCTWFPGSPCKTATRYRSGSGRVASAGSVVNRCWYRC